MSAGDSSRKTLEMECFHTRFSAWTPFSNKSLNRQLFQERVALISHWFDLWTNKQRQEFLFTIFLRCSKSQLRCVQDFSERMQVAKLDFSTVLPRFISLYIFSFLNPKDLCAAAQVSWPWKFLTEQDCLWMSKCIRFGWFLPYTPADNEYGAWKHHYIACVSNLDWLTPREAAAIYGTLNEPKTKYEELQEKQREKCLRKLIWEKSALRKKELFKVRPPWVSGTCCSRLLKSKCQPRLSQALKDLRDRGGLHEALEKQLVLASLEALPKQNNLSGSHSYPLLSKKTWHGVHKNDDSSSHASQPHFLLISSRIPAYEIVVASIRTGIISVVYEHSSLTLDSLLYLIEKALDGQKVQSMGIFSDGDSREINLLQGYKIGIKNLLRPEVRDFWEKLGSYVAPEEEGGHVDLFVPLGASEAGIQVLSQLSQLTGTFFTAPTGIATGSYQHILSDWLGRPERAPCSIYFSESKLYTWSRVTDFLEDTLKSVRKQLSPLFKELQKNISARIIGQFTFDNMNMANILDNQEISQALADGLMELSKDNSDKPLEFLSDFLLKKCGKGSQDLEENVIPTKCDPKAAFSLLPKERNVIEDSPQDTKSSLSKNDPNLEMLVKLCREMIPAFCAFLKRHDKTIATKMLSLAELLLYPSRRFEEYINLLYALRLHTPAEHVDRGDLTTAIDQIKKYKSYIDQMKQNIRMKDQLPDIQRIVRGCPPLSEENRYLIRVQDVAQLHCCDEAVSFPLRRQSRKTCLHSIFISLHDC
ncbi:epithelial cell-transforming sequence 2 oncogene-like isoform X5 [Canis lupus familiaris]|uniref:epithelial cell-transforming sequence 2 oncogene-like isoform X5 n=1 Tax=Canis lupus familiaris TaxID=9615 RepID=UPI0018F615A9|nr:epithelial cell-transforming sequence 2 oncogene-like isoform X5 [Canis lupus familiaris]XP_038510201.1 epithelial cell-transforming sequence 2 oncogene-like isoform X5 [Canis lupus familiaris]